MDDEEFEIFLEIPIRAPFKEKKKNEFLQTLIDQLEEFGAKSSDIKESYYMDRKSAKALQTFVVNIITNSSPNSLAKFSINIINELRDINGIITIKQKNGKLLSITKKMTENEIISFFRKNEN